MGNRMKKSGGSGESKKKEGESDWQEELEGEGTMGPVLIWHSSFLHEPQ